MYSYFFIFSIIPKLNQRDSVLILFEHTSLKWWKYFQTFTMSMILNGNNPRVKGYVMRIFYFFIYCRLFVLILVVFVLFLLHYVSAKFHLWPSSGDLTAKFGRNVVKKKQHTKTTKMRTKSLQWIKKLILRLRSLISKWFHLKTICNEFNKI